MSTQVFVKLLVIFAVVAIGWAVAKSGRLGAGDPARTLSNAAFYIFVPALLFRTTARLAFSRLETTTLLAFFAPTLLLAGTVYVVERWRRRDRHDGAAVPSVRAISSSFGNTVQIGIPLAAALYGEAGLAIHVTIVSLHSLTLLTVLTALVELDLARERRRADPHGAHLMHLLATTARNTIVHPVVLPVLAGLAWNVWGPALPAFADEILQTLGTAVVPLCLVLIGVSLAHYGMRGAVRGAAHALGDQAGRPSARRHRRRPLDLRPQRAAARHRRHDGGVAGRQQRAHLRAALRHAAGRNEQRDRRLDARLRAHRAALAGAAARHRLRRSPPIIAARDARPAAVAPHTSRSESP